MLKSLLSGAFLAGFIGVVALLALSIAAPSPISNVPPDSPLTDAPQVATAKVDTSTDVEPVSAPAEQTTVSQAPTVTEPSTEQSAGILDTTPLELPLTAAVEGALVQPDEVAVPQIDVAGDEPVLLNQQARAPQVPQTEQEVVVSTAPAAPATIEDEGSESETAAVSEEAGSAATDDEPETVANAGAAPETSDLTEQPAVPEIAEALPTAPAAQEQAATVALPSEPTNPSPETPELPQIAGTDAPTTVEPVTEDTPIVTAGVATTSNGLPSGASGVRVNRIIGSQSEADVEVATEPDVDPNAPALIRYAATFENPDGKPAVAIILLDDPSRANAADLIRLLPFPVTVVVDSSTSGAGQRMTAFRDAGAEVALRSTFPQGARPSDVEVTLQSALSTLPETVAFVDEGNTGMQSSRDVSNQTIAAMAEDGRGLVIFPKGLNSALRTASSAGVPAGTIYRDLDGEGQDARVIKRFIDQAAFRARQDGGVILLGRIRPETLDALANWSNANRANQVVMAPLSAMLSASGN